MLTQGLRSSDVKKAELLALAESGAPKPLRGSKQWVTLYSYICESSNAYDRDFRIQLKSRRPDWLVNTVCDGVVRKKKQLIALAKNGANMPKSRTVLREAFLRYVRPKSISYDPGFVAAIEKYNNKWLLKVGQPRGSRAEQRVALAEKKKLLLEMARNGEPRPKQGTPLGTILAIYATPRSCRCDQDFRNALEAANKKWFQQGFAPKN